MSYLNAMSMIRTLDEAYTLSESYSHDEYLNDMLMIENAMYRDINKIADESSIDSIKALTEGVYIDPTDIKSVVALTESIEAEATDKAQNKTIKRLYSEYQHTHKCISETLDFISDNKKDIENTTISTNYEHYNGKCIKLDNVTTYDKLLKKFTTGKEFIDNITNIDTWRGAKVTVPADDVNKKKDILMKNITLLDAFIEKQHKNSVKQLDKLSPSKMVEFASNERKMYSNAIKYCLDTKELLKKFITRV